MMTAYRGYLDERIGAVSHAAAPLLGQAGGPAAQNREHPWFPPKLNAFSPT